MAMFITQLPTAVFVFDRFDLAALVPWLPSCLGFFCLFVETEATGALMLVVKVFGDSLGGTGVVCLSL